MQTSIKTHIARLAGLLVLGASLAACGGGGSDGAAAANETSPTNPVTTPTAPGTPTSPTTPGNHAPTLTGAAILTAATGQSYNFVPAASDADGDRLQFAISSKPSWATFDTATGRLWGVPTSANVGSYEEIEISVSDGKTSTKLPQFAITVAAAAAPSTQSVTLNWAPPTTNTDGTALTNLNGYRILYGTQPGVYTQTVTLTSAGITSYTIDNLQSGKYYVVMVAVNSSGAESDKSKEVVVDLS
jgi:putative Ig domain-containing protein